MSPLDKKSAIHSIRFPNEESTDNSSRKKRRVGCDERVNDSQLNSFLTLCRVFIQKDIKDNSLLEKIIYPKKLTSEEVREGGSCLEWDRIYLSNNKRPTSPETEELAESVVKALEFIQDLFYAYYNTKVTSLTIGLCERGNGRSKIRVKDNYWQAFRAGLQDHFNDFVNKGRYNKFMEELDYYKRVSHTMERLICYGISGKELSQEYWKARSPDDIPGVVSSIFEKLGVSDSSSLVDKRVECFKAIHSIPKVQLAWVVKYIFRKPEIYESLTRSLLEVAEGYVEPNHACYAFFNLLESNLRNGTQIDHNIARSINSYQKTDGLASYSSEELRIQQLYVTQRNTNKVLSGR